MTSVTGVTAVLCIPTTAELPAGVPTGQTSAADSFRGFVDGLLPVGQTSHSIVFRFTVWHSVQRRVTIKLQNMATKALRPCYEQLTSALPCSGIVALDETLTKQVSDADALGCDVKSRSMLVDCSAFLPVPFVATRSRQQSCLGDPNPTNATVIYRASYHIFLIRFRMADVDICL